jgi:hypothetical protein
MVYKTIRRLLGLLATASLAGCGGIGPGDYLVYRIAFQETERSADCYATGQIPVDEQDDSSSLYVSGTFILFVGADESFYLDVGGVTLRGVDEGDQRFVFSGGLVDVNVGGDEDDPTTTTKRIDTSVTFNVDGEVVEGVFQRASSSSCTGPNCAEPPSSSCTETTPFVGGEIDDVRLEHEV